MCEKNNNIVPRLLLPLLFRSFPGVWRRRKICRGPMMISSSTCWREKKKKEKKKKKATTFSWSSRLSYFRNCVASGRSQSHWKRRRLVIVPRLLLSKYFTIIGSLAPFFAESRCRQKIFGFDRSWSRGSEVESYNTTGRQQQLRSSFSARLPFYIDPSISAPATIRSVRR